MKKRCSELLQKWHHILGNDSTIEGGTEGAADIENKDDEPAAQASTSTAPEEKQTSTEASGKVNGTASASAGDAKTEEPKADDSLPVKTTEVEKSAQPETAKATEEPEKSTEKPSEVAA